MWNRKHNTQQSIGTSRAVQSRKFTKFSVVRQTVALSVMQLREKIKLNSNEMKKFSKVFLSFFLVVNLWNTELLAQQDNNDLKNLNLNGKVLSITTYTQINSPDNWIIDNKYVFNNEGNIISVGFYDIEGAITSYSERFYDGKGFEIERKSSYRGDLTTHTYFAYDSAGNFVKNTSYDNKGNQSYKYIYFYDKNGNLTEECDYENSETLKEKSVYKYDQNNNKIQIDYYKENILVKIDFLKYTYSSDKNIISKEINYEKGKVIFDYEGKKLIKETSSTTKSLKISIYNQNGDLVKVSGNYNTQPSYGDNINLNYKYEYDSQNNWVKQYMSDYSGNYKIYAKRELTYYQ